VDSRRFYRLKRGSFSSMRTSRRMALLRNSSNSRMTKRSRNFRTWMGGGRRLMGVRFKNQKSQWRFWGCGWEDAGYWGRQPGTLVGYWSKISQNHVNFVVKVTVFVQSRARTWKTYLWGFSKAKIWVISGQMRMSTTSQNRNKSNNNFNQLPQLRVILPICLRPRWE
jgi:hypothetical protein